MQGHLLQKARGGAGVWGLTNLDENFCSATYNISLESQRKLWTLLSSDTLLSLTMTSLGKCLFNIFREYHCGHYFRS